MTCRNLATISSGLYRFLAITVLLDVKDIPQVGPLQWGWISTILIAAERTGRKARALELDPTYVDVGVRRWQNYTGKSAVLAASGETFETIEEQRAATPAAA